MEFFIIALLSLSATFLAVVGVTPAVTQSVTSPVPPCHDWGESREGARQVLEGEAGWLDCPLFSHPTIYNYSSAVAAGLNLVWYHMAAGQDLEQPLDFHQPDHRLSKERDRLWLLPVITQDTGQYLCMLRNKTSCAKIAVRLEVKPRSQNPECEVTSAVSPQQAIIPIQEGKTLSCPDEPSTKHSVLWFHVSLLPSQKCKINPLWGSDREVQDNKLVVHNMLELYQGPYYCVVTFESKGKNMNFTRMINVTAVSPSGLPKEPMILNPDKKQVFPVKLGSDVYLKCKVKFPYLEGSKDMWWTIDGKAVDNLDPRITSKSEEVSNYFGDVDMENVLHIRDFNSEDLTREYNCSARNQRGFSTCRAVLEEEVYLPYVELGCGLGVTLLVMLGLFVVYQVFWLELLLLYRSWFGTDERFTDDKEYDIYISYARNSEEEHFVLMTLRRVLENELGYSVCIFDRDSLPGGTITDETLNFVGRSRRLLVVLSPGYGLQGTQPLLELKAGLDSMAWGGQLRVILLQYKPLNRDSWVRELRRARLALVLVRWQGDKSVSLSSRFWKRLRLELPVRRMKSIHPCEGVAVPLTDKPQHKQREHDGVDYT
ncbi:interleukin-1 receptor accessory protein-like [Hypomesus transpacificus]|uniref:interleukin-1 receptor accessory protein-like n=1 Tax=Hypomesus transpacificus TaxID=137520 RepID=UPI001F07AC37|nr:interleukin-1 receptor accessory protein-like [Hypomesus transpacificus]